MSERRGFPRGPRGGTRLCGRGDGGRRDRKREPGVVVVNGVEGPFQANPGRQGFTGAEVPCVLRVGATGELQSEPVTLQQPVRAGRQPRAEVLNLARARCGVKSDNDVGDVVGAAFLVDVADA